MKYSFDFSSGWAPWAVLYVAAMLFANESDGWLTLTSPEEKRNPLHQASPHHFLAADSILSATNSISIFIRFTEYHCYKTVKVLKKPVPSNVKAAYLFESQEVSCSSSAATLRYSLCCCCRWYRQKLTVATFSRCLWRLEKILIDRHQGASCYGTHPAPINYNYNYLHFCELDGPILPTNISTANIPSICKTPFK